MGWHPLSGVISAMPGATSPGPPPRPSAGAAVLNRVITALTTSSYGRGFDVFTDEPLR
jgi:hypothetical protein